MSAATQVDETQNPPPEDTSNEITLYVNGLPYNNCTQEEVKKLFEKYGEVINVTHRKNRKSGYFTGNSFVTFAKKEDGEKAIQELNGYEYKGRQLRVEKANRPFQRDYKSKVEDRKSYRDDRDDSPRYSRYRDEPYDRDYQPRYSDRYYESQVPYRDGGRSRGSYRDYPPDPYYYDNYRRGGSSSSGYRDYVNYDAPRYSRREEYYESRQSQRSPRYYSRYKSDEYDN